jgi:hypothetical protein
MKATVLALAGLLLAAPVAAEMTLEQKQGEIDRLGFLVGEWTGSGWMQRGPERHEFESRESIREAAGGLVLLIEGTHTGFSALGVVSAADSAGAYAMRSWTSEGRGAEAAARISAPGVFEWGFDRVRYTITVTAAGEWSEIGEYRLDSGQWTNFFRMDLKRTP